ncbi:MAG: hypothetical protein M1820_010084 [Bogoriella megaspora]|nr:MAG: hypothetical protein M1820_010084 [Bogoriella megaspora]
MSHAEDKRIHFFASPLTNPRGTYSPAKHGDEEVQVSNVQLTHTISEGTPPYANEDECLHDSPAFKRHSEATSTELFYDLFFVANLTTFTSSHEINDHKQLTSYIGFFCILWFTWYQVSLHDLRFSVDSLFERVCKALQFGFMVGFAVTGTKFQPDDEELYWDYFRDLSYILMGTRFVLMFQYIAALWFTKEYERVRLPLLLIIINCAVAAFAYLGLSFAFKYESTGPHAYIGWYVISVAETALTTAVSSSWRQVSFKGTHMVQRMSLLTLIILGEGIIGLTKSITYIVKNDNVFTSAIIGNIAAAVLVIYFLFLIYFHRMTEHHFGTIRQQIWSFLHFPLHVALVLTMEGSRQFVLWRQGVQLAGYLTDSIEAVIEPYDLDQPQPEDTYSSWYDQFNDIAYNQTFLYSPKGSDISEYENKFNNALETFYNVSLEVAHGESNATDEIATTIANMWTVLSDAVFAMVGIPVEEESKDDSEEPNAAAEDLASPKWYTLFRLVFIYTFVCAGLTLMIMGVLGLISHHHKTTAGRIRSAVTLVIGLGICLLSIISVSDDTFGDYVGSAWVLPTLVLSFFVVVVVDNIRKH